MIYLIRMAHLVTDEENGTCVTTIPVLKIGYSADPSGTRRFKSYEALGPIMILAKINGDGADLKLEQALHNHFESLRVYKNEWYSDCEEITEFFKEHSTADSILDYLKLNDPRSLRPKIKLLSRKKLDAIFIETVKLENPELISLAQEFVESPVEKRMYFIIKTILNDESIGCKLLRIADKIYP